MRATYISLQLYGFLSSIAVGVYALVNDLVRLSLHLEPVITCQNLCVSLHPIRASCHRCGLAGHYCSFHVEATDHQYMLRTHERR